MEWNRLTGVTGAGGPGSGYVVAPRLVLTSAHVVGHLGAKVEVFRPGRKGIYVGRVVWCGVPGGRDDAALVAIDDSNWTPVAGVVKWGQTITHRPGLRCECWGVPDVMQRPGSPVDTAQPTGTLNPGDRMATDRYSIRLDGRPPATRKDGRSPWGGLSGAGLFCHDLLIGVIASDSRPFRHSVLEAVPAYVLHHDREFRKVLASHTPVTVIEAAELAELASPEPAPHPQGATVSPAELLTARRAVVPFQGRAELLEQLQTWAKRPGAGVHLVYGPGGQGKTRLARHFSDQFVRIIKGGKVLWLDHTAESLEVIAEAVVPVLVIVDYAESRFSQLKELLTALAVHRPSPAVKVLALARTTGDWWDQLIDTSDAVATLLDAATKTALPILDATETARQAGYRTALGAFAEELSHLPGHADADWLAQVAPLAHRALPSAAAGWTVLALQMTALADLLDATTESGIHEDNRSSSSASEGDSEHNPSPEERVLRHERRYWRNTATTSELFPALPMNALTNAVAAAVLLVPPTATQANEWLSRIPELSHQSQFRRDQVRMWLASLYPAAGRYAFGQLEPDWLGEHLIGTLINNRPRTSIVETLAAYAKGEDAIRWVSVCARTAAHRGFGDSVGEMLTRMLEQHPVTVGTAALAVAPGLEAPQPLVQAVECLVRDPETSTASLTSLADVLPKNSLLWKDTEPRIFEALIDRSKPKVPEEGDVQDKRKLDILGIDRIQFCNEVTGLANNAAESLGLRIEWSRSDLAANLDRYASGLASTGQNEEALAASAEAVQMYRRLSEGSESRELPPADDSAEEQGS